MVTVKRTRSAPGLYSGTPGSSTRVEVSDLSAVVQFDGKLVTLSWSAPNVPHNPAVSQHQIYKAGQFINTVAGNIYTYEDAAVTPGVSYVYQVFLIYNPT